MSPKTQTGSWRRELKVTRPSARTQLQNQSLQSDAAPGTRAGSMQQDSILVTNPNPALGECSTGPPRGAQALQPALCRWPWAPGNDKGSGTPSPREQPLCRGQAASRSERRHPGSGSQLVLFHSTHSRSKCIRTSSAQSKQPSDAETHGESPSPRPAGFTFQERRREIQPWLARPPLPGAPSSMAVT